MVLLSQKKARTENVRASIIPSADAGGQRLPTRKTLAQKDQCRRLLRLDWARLREERLVFAVCGRRVPWGVELVRRFGM